MDGDSSNKERNKKKSFSQDDVEQYFNNNSSKNDQSFLNQDKTENTTPHLKEDFKNAEKQIDTLFLNKTEPTNGKINQDIVTSEDIEIDQDIESNLEKIMDQSKQDEEVIPKKVTDTSTEQRTEDTFDFSQSQNKIEEQKTKKSLSIPKIKIRVNKNRFPRREKQSEKKNAPSLFSNLLKKDSKKANVNSGTIIEPPETDVSFENKKIENVSQEKSELKSKKKWFVSKENTLPLDTENKKSTGKKPWPLFKEKDTTKTESFEKHSYPNENHKKIADDEIVQHEEPVLDEDVRKLLAITDELLGKLPEEVIEEFASSDDFALYQRVMNKFHIK